MYKIENLSFKYPGSLKNAIGNISMNIKKGEFIVVLGKSGCGKSTLLRQLKPILSPFGERSGKVLFEGENILELNQREQCEKIGFVLQNPDNQIVCDMVWHELAFGLENLGYDKNEIRLRVSEMATYFGIEKWFYKKVCNLSGGEKQLLNLAAIMVMQPDVLILDEPTAMLDPIAAGEFLQTVKKINIELGVTVILSEHRLEEVLPLSDRVIVLDDGELIADCEPCKIFKEIKDNDIIKAMPLPIRLFSKTNSDGKCPVTVKEGREWLLEQIKSGRIKDIKKEEKIKIEQGTIKVELKDIWFRYEKNSPDILKGLNLKIEENKFYAIVGANGAGKTTALSVLCSIEKHYHGKILIDGKEISNRDTNIAMLVQNPQLLFVKNTLLDDLLGMLDQKKLTKEKVEEKMLEVVTLCELEGLLDRHPYDLSGGELQRAALAKLLLCEPEILLLDEPTKGLDAHFKEKLADILNNLKKKAVTIVMVSHDIEFCAKYADRCVMFFDGQAIGEDCCEKFFLQKFFYTTQAQRMSRGLLSSSLLEEDIIKAFE